MLAHILGEVGTLCTVLLSVYSRTGHPICLVETGSYLTEKAGMFFRQGVQLGCLPTESANLSQFGNG